MSHEIHTPLRTGTLPHVNLSLLAANVGKAATNTLDGGQGIHDLLLAIHVSVKQTQNVLKLHANEEGTHLGCEACRELGSGTHGTERALASAFEALLYVECKLRSNRPQMSLLIGALAASAHKRAPACSLCH